MRNISNLEDGTLWRNPLTEHLLCLRLTKAIRERNPKLARKKDKETWEVKRVLDPLRKMDSQKAELEQVVERQLSCWLWSHFGDQDQIWKEFG